MKKLANNKFILNIQTVLLYILPAVVFFSYHPVITVGEDSTMNLEFSITLIWLLIFSIISLPTDIIFIYNFLKSEDNKKPKLLFFFTSIFFIYALASVIWSKNFNRAVLTAGILGCIVLSVISIFNIINNNKDNLKITLQKIILISAFIICVWCWLQSILDVFQIDSSITMMCLGCKTITFGFPHPNGFSAEPQYMGNLLLIPAFIALHNFFQPTIFSRRTNFLFSIAFVSTLFLTLSRGAIYAFCLGYLFFIIFLFVKKTKVKTLCLSILSVFLSFILVLFAQGIFSELSYTNDTFLTGIKKSLNQLSLGIIDLPVGNQTTEKEKTNKSLPENEEISSIHNGYIEASTNERLTLTFASLKLWTSNPMTFIFGVGIGGAGSAINEAYKNGFYNDGFLDQDYIDEAALTSPKKIIQNEYAEILLEFGIIGIVLILIFLILFITILKDQKNKVLYLSILVSFGVSFTFFSGLPNVLHIYLIFPLLLATRPTS